MTPTGARDEDSVTVFLLDDHELLRRGLRRVVDAEPGLRVVGESGSAREATRRIPALRPKVMLLDVRLPDGSGIDVCRRVRSLDPAIRALMLTTFDDQEARAAAALAGASGFVLKQIRSGELIAALRAVAAGQEVSTGQGSAADVRDLVRERDAMDVLTPREREVLDLVAQGLTNAQIGQRLGVGEKTVKNHVTSLLGKLGFARRTQAAVYLAQRQDSSEAHRAHASGSAWGDGGHGAGIRA